MKKAILTLILAAVATPALAATATETAVSIEPVFSSTTRTECVQASAPGWLGQALGGVLGAAVGSQLGSGKGNTIATASGTVLGAQAGGAIAGNQAQPAQTCRDITERRLDGYQVQTDRGRQVFVPLHLVPAVQR
ncbi:MAG: hypothetical protein M0Z99_13320 [Betaproteobacteria bacterium]|nr:hypothetical protein [Betaproteobacteria bacterium]